MSPLRHYQGSLPAGKAAWTCPTCGSSQTGLLEDGCQACGAGKDAKKVDIVHHAPQATVKQAMLQTMDTHVENYAAVWASAHPDASLIEAFVAGMQWARGYTGGGVPGPEGEPAVIALTDPVVRATLAAALAFYIDHQLSYGPVPGQLAVEDAKALLAQLQPPAETEEPEPAPPTFSDIPF